jgi:hypothetical protein
MFYVSGTFHVKYNSKSFYDFTTLLSFPRTRRTNQFPRAFSYSEFNIFLGRTAFTAM